MGGTAVENTTRILYKRCIFLRVNIKKHVSALYDHHQVWCQLRFHYINCVNCVMMWRSQHEIIVELYILCTGGYYARLKCCVKPVAQGSHPGVCRVSANWMSSTLSSRRLLLWGCLWMT